MLLRFAVAMLIGLGFIAGSGADEFPSRVVTIISPYQAGGTSDIIARVIAKKLSAR